MAAPAAPLVDYDDSEYESAADDDFLPDADAATAPASASEASDSEEDGDAALAKSEKPKTVKRKRPTKKDEGEEAEDIGFENSGDEAIIGKGLKKAKRRKRRGEEEDDEGGEGGFVKTRRMAAMAEEEKAPLVTTAESTVDVDALWASMLAAPINDPKRHSIPAPIPTTDGLEVQAGAPVSKTEAAAASNLTSIPNPAEDDDTVTIHRTYQFAGKTHTETKVVPRNSAEARLYLASNPEAADQPTALSPPRRRTKLARRSVFEPPCTLPPRPDLKLGVGTIRERLTLINGKEDKGKKLNTVEKSKMDWAGFVDKEGIREDLEKAEKAKGSYLQRREFLDRVAGKRDEEERRARLGAAAKAS